MRRRIHRIPLLFAFVWLSASIAAWASEYHGQVFFGDVAVPGATVTVTEGERKFTTVTDRQGLYEFADLADGQWKIEIEMSGFLTLDGNVTVSPEMEQGNWELKLLDIDQMLARAQIGVPLKTRPEAETKPQAIQETPKPADTNPAESPQQSDDAEKSADGMLINGSESNAATSQYSMTSAFTLLPGRYSMKFLARDDETGRIGTYQTEFIIPNLNKETTHVPISSVVLSSQRVDTKDALYNVSKGKEQIKNDAKNPLVEEGLKLIPSVTRVFNVAREMYVYLQAYEGNPTGATAASASAKPAPLIAFVSLYREGKKAFESAPIAVTPGPESRLGVAPLNFKIGLGSLAPGQYQCQVSVLDPAGHRVAFWVNPIMLVR